MVSLSLSILPTFMPGSAAKKKKKDLKKDADFTSDSCVFNRNIQSNIMLSKNNLLQR